MLLVISSCTLPWSPPPSATTPPSYQDYPSTQSGTPAAKFCVANGGAVSYEKNPSVDMDLIYCTLPGKERVDAWQYMNFNTTQTGAAAL